MGWIISALVEYLPSKPFDMFINVRNNQTRAEFKDCVGKSTPETGWIMFIMADLSVPLHTILLPFHGKGWNKAYVVSCHISGTNESSNTQAIVTFEMDGSQHLLAQSISFETLIGFFGWIVFNLAQNLVTSWDSLELGKLTRIMDMGSISSSSAHFKLVGSEWKCTCGNRQ